MVHTTFYSEYHFGKRSSRLVELSSNLYQVVINGEDGEYIEYESRRRAIQRQAPRRKHSQLTAL